jgi:hypothetical protein
LAWVLSACGEIGRAAEVTPAASVTPVENDTTGDGQDEEPKSLLVWEGQGPWGDDDATRCKTLDIGADGQMQFGLCDQPLTTAPLDRPEFDEIVRRLAAFELQTPTDSLTVRGQGQIDDPAWQRAVLAWARWTFGESWSGGICAACRTALSWHLGPLQANATQCAHLTVLDYGFAYAEVLPCDGGPVIAQSNGWLETGEWARLDEWLTGRSALYSSDNYLVGTGSQDMTDEENAAVETLARTIYTRISGTGLEASQVGRFLEQLDQAVESRARTQLGSLIGDRFLLAGWRSQGSTYAPEAAIDQLLTNYLSPDGLSFDTHTDLTALLDGTDPLAIVPPDVVGVKAVFASGWGLSGQDEAILYLAPHPDGSLYWYGVLIAIGGFASQSLTPPPDGDPTAACPPVTDETRLLWLPAHGYCLLYPIGYKVEKPNEMQTDLVIGSLLNVQGPRVSIVVEQAAGRTVGAVADQLLADLPDFDIQRGEANLGGTEAIVLDGLPGQEINRRVIAEHDGRLYQFTFTPADQGLGDVYERMEALYAGVLASFTFIPVSIESSLGQDCLEAKANEQPLTYAAYNFCLLSPIGYAVDEPSANRIVLYVGSLLGVEHAKAFIEVSDAGGRAAEQIAADLASELEASMPGYTAELNFGLSVGYEPAWVLEKVPGQDISRQVIVVHDDQLYRLTFVPADVQVGDAYAQMESLYSLVINSFRFLQ